jgi:hypothetical protein
MRHPVLEPRIVRVGALRDRAVANGVPHAVDDASIVKDWVQRVGFGVRGFSFWVLGSGFSVLRF